MVTTLAAALTALEQAAGRIERLEGRIAERSADAGRLRQEVERAISELDQMIEAAPTDGGAHHG